MANEYEKLKDRWYTLMKEKRYFLADKIKHEIYLLKLKNKKEVKCQKK